MEGLQLLAAVGEDRAHVDVHEQHVETRIGSMVQHRVLGENVVLDHALLGLVVRVDQGLVYIEVGHFCLVCRGLLKVHHLSSSELVLLERDVSRSGKVLA